MCTSLSDMSPRACTGADTKQEELQNASAGSQEPTSHLLKRTHALKSHNMLSSSDEQLLVACGKIHGAEEKHSI